MKPGSLNFDYFDSLFFVAYKNSLGCLSFYLGSFKTKCRSMIIKTELLRTVGCLDSELL